MRDDNTGFASLRPTLYPIYSYPSRVLTILFRDEEKNFKMTSSALVLLHVVSVAMFSYTLYYASFVMDIPFLKKMFSEFDPGQLKYLTMWDVILQAVFFFICLLNDFFGTNKVTPKKVPIIRKVKDYVHATLSFPVAMFVGVTFWALMFVDRELVLPKALDPYFPWWLNHLMHTMIMVSTLLEMIMAPRQYPSRAAGLTGLLLFMLTYLVWMHVVYIKSGIWVYPIMEVLSLPLRVVFFASLFGLVTLLYYIGEWMDHLVWGNEQTKTKKSSSKSK